MTVQEKPAGMQPRTVSQKLAEWAATLGPQDIPEAMCAAAANTMLDTIGLSIAACETDYARALRASALSQGECIVMGTGDRRDPFEAALINGTTAHGEDFDNTFEGCPVHSGAVIVPAVFAAGQAHGLNAARVALGVAAGMELMCRLGVVTQKGVHAQGFHPTSVLGTMSAALGVAVARGLHAPQIVNALGLAGSMASGIIEYLADGTWTKRMHAGWAAQAGIRAAAMGAAGFLGPVSVFEGTHGLYKAFAPSLTPDFSILTQGLGSRWVAADVAFKPYACGTMTQPYIDCAVRLAQREVNLDAIERITCKVGHGTVHRLWEPLALKQSPPTPYAAKFSGPYTVAAGLVWQDAGLAQFTPEALADPRAAALARKVEFIVDPDNAYPANYTGDVALHLKSGEVIEEHQAQMRGGVHQPMSRGDLLRKCAANLTFGDWQGMSAKDMAAMLDTLFTSEAAFSADAFGR